MIRPVEITGLRDFMHQARHVAMAGYTSGVIDPHAVTDADVFDTAFTENTTRSQSGARTARLSVANPIFNPIKVW